MPIRIAATTASVLECTDSFVRMFCTWVRSVCGLIPRVVEIVSVQNRYNVSDRSSDPVLEVCERDGLAFIPWSPLSQSPGDSNAASRVRLQALAEQRGLSFPQAAIAWLLARSPVMLPIPGTSRLSHLEENVAAAAVALSAAEMSAIG